MAEIADGVACGQPELARGRRREPSEHAQQRRLARAVRAGDEQEPAGGQVEVDRRRRRAGRRSASQGRARRSRAVHPRSGAVETVRLAGGRERVGDLLHLADPPPAFRRRGVLGPRQALCQLGRREPPLLLDVEVPRDVVDRRAASRRFPSTTPRTPSSAQTHSRRHAARGSSRRTAPRPPRRPGPTSRGSSRARRAAPPTMPPSTKPRVQRRDLLCMHRRDRVRIDVDAAEARELAGYVERRVRRADREDQLGLSCERAHRAGVAKRRRAGTRRFAAALRRPDHVMAVRLQHPPTAEPISPGWSNADDHRTSASTKAKNASEITPFIVKNAASSRRRSPGRTSECS